MTDDEIVYLSHAHYATSGEINDVIIFARAIEHCTLTKQKARWYQEGVEAGLHQATKREWVGLTHEDMEGMFLNTEGIRIARYIEAKIKEKNCG